MYNYMCSVYIMHNVMYFPHSHDYCENKQNMYLSTGPIIEDSYSTISVQQ